MISEQRVPVRKDRHIQDIDITSKPRQFSAVLGALVLSIFVLISLFAGVAVAQNCAGQTGLEGGWRSKNFETMGGRVITFKHKGGGLYWGYYHKPDGTGKLYIRVRRTGPGRYVGKETTDDTRHRTRVVVNGNAMTTHHDYYRKEWGWRKSSYSEYHRYCPGGRSGGGGGRRQPGGGGGGGLLGIMPGGSSGSGGVSEPNRHWWVHCESINPFEGCGCVNHSTNSYNPAMQAPWIQYGPVTWTQCAQWMRSRGFPGW